MNIYHQFTNLSCKTKVSIFIVCGIILIAELILLATLPCNNTCNSVAVDAECLNLSDNEEICIETEDTETISLETRYNSIFEWQKYCGDFGMEQLIFLNEQCVKYEIPVEIMLALICTESSFRSDARASTSSASGYCQIIRSTAQWIYEDKLGYGTYDIYNHEAIMTTNWRLNIEIACRLIYCLYWNSDQSWDIAIQKYYGGSEQACLIYLNTVNKNMSELFNLTTKNFK